MHTRRVGAFLVGALLLGTAMMPFILSQSLMTAERVLGGPPPQVQKQFDDAGPEVMRQILRHQALQFNRHLTASWEVLQIGLVAALLATAVLTSHRSRVVVGGSALMLALLLYMHFVLSPDIVSLSRSYDFLPAGAATRARDAVQAMETTYRVLAVFKTIIALVIAARLLFDRYELQTKLIGKESKPKGERRLRRRQTRGDRHAASAASAPAAAVDQVDTVDDAEDGHINR